MELVPVQPRLTLLALLVLFALLKLLALVALLTLFAILTLLTLFALLTISVGIRDMTSHRHGHGCNNKRQGSFG